MRLLKLIGLCFLLIYPLYSKAQNDFQLYINAKQALKNHDDVKVQILKDKLKDSPLLANIEYLQIKRNFTLDNTAELQQFVNNHPQSPMSTWLMRQWLTALKEKEMWPSFIAHYRPVNNTKLKCTYIHALQTLGKNDKANTLIKTMWLTKKTLPPLCEQAFITWLETHPDRDTFVWRRFILALKKYQYPLARKLVPLMNMAKQEEANAILSLYKQPNLVTLKQFVEKHPRPEVLSFGLYRLARINPKSAVNNWLKLKNQFQFTEAQRVRVLQAIALKYAFRKNVNGLKWYHQLAGAKMDRIYEEWLLRAALNHKDWSLIKRHFEAIQDKRKDSTKLQYWYARALDKLQDKDQAQKIFQALAKKRDYYGFLASQFLNQPINVLHMPMNITEADIDAVKELPGYQRAKLFHDNKREHQARVELIYLMKHRDNKEKYIIAKLVHDWGWHSESIRLSSKIKHKDDITLRFPLKYKDTVLKEAKKRKLHPELVYAIIRQESQFTAKIRSHAGAIGLMQLMPKTASLTARQYKLKYKGKYDLLKPLTNIEFGTAHLNRLKSELNNHPLLVIAAYNAGKLAVKRWLPKNQRAIPADIWVETIPYYETRKYLRHVIANHVVYQHRLGKEPKLNHLMLKIR